MALQPKPHILPPMALPSLRDLAQPSSRTCRRAAKSPATRCHASIDDIEPVPGATLPSLSSADDIQFEAAWLAGIIRLWLDEEWTPLEVHRDLGAAAAALYVGLREAGAEGDVADIVLGLGQGLAAGFNFREAFVGPFDVANKVVEILMIKRSGANVCCVSEAQRADLDRWDAAVREELGVR